MNMEKQLKEMWRTRPVRLSTKRRGGAPIAGVCEGIGVRYQVDPTIVRVIFVVLLLFGSGLSLYLVCWLVMPRYSVPKAPVDVLLNNRNGRYSSDQTTGWVLIVVLILITGPLAFSPLVLDGGALFTIAIALLGWWALHQRCPQPPEGLWAYDDEETATEAATVDSPPVNLSGYRVAEGFNAPFTPPKPPAWDPLGTVPQLWHLPEPHEPEETPEPPRSRRRGWLIAIRAIVITGTVLAATVITAIFIIPMMNMDDDGYSSDVSAGDRVVAPVDPNSLPNRYTHTLGSFRLDLTQLKQLDHDTALEVSLGVGDTVVQLPEAIPVDVTCTAKVGSVTCPEGRVNPDAKGGVLTLNVNTKVGSAVVTDGTAAEPPEDS